MSTKFKSNVVATALVVIMLALGSLFGYTILGGGHRAPANAVIPQQDNTCLVCGHGSGGVGQVPPNPASPLTGTGGSGGTGTGGHLG